MCHELVLKLIRGESLVLMLAASSKQARYFAKNWALPGLLMNNPRTHTQPRLLKAAPHKGLRGLRGLQGLFCQKTFWEGCLTVSREYIYTNPRSPHYPRTVTDTNGFRNSLTPAEPPQPHTPTPTTPMLRLREKCGWPWCFNRIKGLQIPTVNNNE